MTLRFALLLLVAVFCMGCVHVEQTFTFYTDGSGIFEFSYGMPEERVEHMEHLASLIPNGAREQATTPHVGSLFVFDEAPIKSAFADYARHGVQLDSLKTEHRNGYRYVRMVVRFETLNGLAKTSLLTDRDIALMKDDRGNYVFDLAASGGAVKPEDLPGMGDPNVEPFIDELMSGFRVISRVRTPSPIISTTAPERDSTEATWVFDFDSDDAALEKMRTEHMRVVFDGAGVDIRSFNSATM